MTAVFAHRGAHGECRENTLEAFRAAVALGVDGVELDVRRSREGVLVVHHDPTIGGRPIAATPFADLPDYVPTLAAAMDELAGVRVNVEIKNSRDPGEGDYDESGRVVREVLDLLHDTDRVADVIVSCFDLATCARARDYDVDVAVAWLVDAPPLHEVLVRAHVLGLDAVNPHFRLVDPEVVDEARRWGLAVNAWTVNRARDLRAMLAAGVASVITDQPARALDLVAAARG